MAPVLSFDEAEQYLGEVADALPAEIFTGLNGGITLLPDEVPSPHGAGLYTLGTYHYEPQGMGRYISIHYGSFVRVAGGRSLDDQKQSLREVLHHELTHHLESMAGVRDLEEKDARDIEAMRRGRPKDT
ncbi:MAG: hypothetical protein AB7V55_04710 [Oscillospiraceae bacterium]